MQLHNLTEEQRLMMDKLWQIDSLEELAQFRASLPKFRQQQVDTLLEMIRLQLLDDWLDTQPEDDYTELSKILLHTKS
jgi:hypothetical protein